MTLPILGERSLLLAIAIICAGFLLKRGSASGRHLIFAGGLLGLLLLPAIGSWAPTPAVRVESLPAPLAIAATRVFSVPQGSAVPSHGRVGIEEGSRAIDPVSTLIAVWAVGAFVLFGRMLWQLGKVVRLVAGGERRRIEGTSREVRVVDSVQVPSTAWVGRPVILLPRGFETWSGARLRSVLLHEEAHILRGDWFVTVLGKVACALYWPNPLVWVLQRAAVDLAEKAADDVVLNAGIVPSVYAEDLLTIASKARDGEPVMAVSMALRSNVGRRIEEILNPRRSRRTIRYGALVATALGVGASAVPAADLLFSQKRPNPASIYADVRLGKSAPGTESSGFMATLSGGRKVELVQLARFLKGGAVEVWGPDGVPIPPEKRLPVSYFEDMAVQITLRYRTEGRVTDSGLESKPEIGGMRRGLPYSLGGMSHGNGEGLDTLNFRIRRDVPKLGDYTFRLADGSEEVTAWQDLKTGRRGGSGQLADHLSIEKNARSLLRHKDGEIVEDLDRNYGGAIVPATLVQCSIPGIPTEYVNRIVARPTRGFGEVRGILSTNISGANQTYFPLTADIGRCEVHRQHMRAAEFLGVRQRPNGAAE